MNQSEKEYYYQEELRKLELERRAKELRDQDMAYETSALIDKSKEEEKKKTRERIPTAYRTTNLQRSPKISRRRPSETAQRKTINRTRIPTPPRTTSQ